MKAAIALCFLLPVMTWCNSSYAVVYRGEFPGIQPTRISAKDIEQDHVSETRFTHFSQFLKSLDVTEKLTAVDERNHELVSTRYAVSPDQEIWNGFFQSAAKDKITSLRAFAMLGREVKRSGIAIFGGDGEAFEKAIESNQVEMGLSLPAMKIMATVWNPRYSDQDPELQAQLTVFYAEPYTYSFPDEILPANLKVGQGEKKTIWIDGEEKSYPTVVADIYYGPKNGIGLRNVRGVAGQKRGVVGFFQKLLFFLPDAIKGMTIHESTDELVTEAVVNTKLKKFEATPVYAIKFRNGKT